MMGISYQLSYDLIPLFVAALVSFTLAGYIWRRRVVIWSLTYVLLMTAVGIWCLGYAGELAFYNAFWTYFLYVGIVYVPPLWFLFVFQYTGRDKWLDRLRIGLLFVLPTVNLLLVWFNAYIPLYYTYIGPMKVGEFFIVDVHYGPMFWVHTVYSYSLLLSSTIVLFITIFRSFQMYRDQFISLLLAVVTPWIGNAIYIAGLSPHMDLTPVAFAVTGLILVWSIFKYQFLDVIPIARDTVVEKMSDGMIVLDMQYRIVDLNPAAQKITGRSEKDALGSLVSLVLPDHPELIRQLYGATETRAEITFGGEVPLYYDMHISPLRGKRGEQNGRLIIFSDVTERKKAEEERERMLNDIQQANQQLRKIDQAKDEFLSIVTHDLKTPLTVILGYVGVMLSGMSGEVSPQQKGMLETIKKQANNQQDMIDTILDYTRMEFGRITVNPEEFSFSAMVGELAEAEKMEAGRKKITINVELPPQELLIQADKRMMGRVINNLIGNAIKYTPESGTISVVLQAGDGTIRLSVADSGIGIAAENLSRIFEKFYVVDAAGARERRSLGLGLSIVKSFVEAHHGRIWVESEGLGRGSKFLIEMPAEYKE